MKTQSIIVTLLAYLISATACGDDNWPQFRGPGGLGIGSGNPPTKWDTQTGHSVAWKTPIPGLGHSAPIVWGDLIYRQRVGTGSRTFSASAVAAGGHIYFVSEQGEVTVIEEGKVFNEVARNEMGEVVMATPAISRNRLLIRTVGSLHCLVRK